MSAWERFSWPALLLLTATLLVVSALGWIGSLGLEYDEAHFLPTALKIAHGAEEFLPPPWGFTVAHRPVPLMTMPYVGTGDALLYAAAYRLFGNGILIARWVNIALGIAVLWLTLLLARREGGLPGAGFAAALLLVDLEWLLHVPTNFGPFLLQQALGIGAVYALSRWWGREGERWFYLAVALLALAFHEKLTFLWVLSSLFLAILLFRARASAQVLRWRTLPLGLLLAVLIVSPILYFTWANPEVVLGFGRQNTKLPTDWPRLLADRWHTLDLMFQGNWTMEFTAGPSAATISRGPALWLLFAAGLLVALLRRHTLALLLYFLCAGIFAWNLIFPDAGRMHHLLLIVPYWQCAAALAFATLPRWPRAAILVLLLWSATSTVRCVATYSSAVQANHGVNHWSDMTTRATEWLLAHPELEAATTSWGLARPLFVLSGGRLDLEEHVFDTLSPNLPTDATRAIDALLAKSRVVWLVSSVMPSYSQQFDRITEIAARSGKSPQLVATIASPTGVPAIHAYRFDASPALPTRWITQPGPTISLPPDWLSVRLAWSGIADAEDEDFTLEWLSADGKTLFSDSRPLRWFPLLSPRPPLEFGRDFYPRRFNRQVASPGEPATLRLRTRFHYAAIPRIEVGLR